MQPDPLAAAGAEGSSPCHPSSKGNGHYPRKKDASVSGKWVTGRLVRIGILRKWSCGLREAQKYRFTLFLWRLFCGSCPCFFLEKNIQREKQQDAIHNNQGEIHLMAEAAETAAIDVNPAHDGGCDQE